LGSALPVASGGTGLTAGTSGGVLAYTASGTLASSALLTQYGVVYGGGAGAAPVATANGTTGQAFIATTSGAPSWGTLPVVGGGTGQTTYTDGQLLIGNTTGNTLTKATLTAGSGVTITNSPNTYTTASDITVTFAAPPAGVNSITATGNAVLSSTGRIKEINIIIDTLIMKKNSIISLKTKIFDGDEPILTKKDTLFIVTTNYSEDSLHAMIKNSWETEGIFIVLFNLAHLQINILQQVEQD
jgi:hypothetical protein